MNLSQAKSARKQLNLNKLGDVGGSQIHWPAMLAKTDSPNYFGISKLTLLILGLAPFLAFADPVHPVVIPQSSLLKTALPVTDEDELAVIGRLIRTTEDQLKMQQHLKDLMIRFKQLKEAFVQGDQTKKNASVMVRTAREILDIIANQHLQFHFSKDYLDELTVFSSIAGKNGIKRP